MAKKDVHGLVEDLLNGSVNGESFNNQSIEDMLKAISDNYDYTEEELFAELKRQQPRVEEMIGLPLTEEQMEALCGGKGKAHVDVPLVAGAAAGGVAAVGGATVAGIVGGYVLTALVAAAIAAK